MKTLCILLTTLWLIISPCLAEDTTAQALVFQAQEGFTLRLPADWIEIPRAALDEYTERIKKTSPNLADTPAYAYGFQLAYKKKWLTYPYILVQVNRNGRLRKEELQRYEALTTTLQAEVEGTGQNLSNLLSKAELGETLYDETNQILWLRMSVDVVLQGKVEALLAAKLTNFGLITLMAYAPAKNFAYYQPVFQALATNLELEPGIQYASGSGASGSSGNNPFTYMSVGMVLAAFGVIKLLLKKISC